ncbi:response regulator [Gloeocapsopsis dulcis]|uniref:response regulator n=1 Tax=Gloeocapsopsis dulcis TaxID=2859516 RepID=UPI0012DACBFD|nr:response regulator [Gloeocapsopsis dulcis]
MSSPDFSRRASVIHAGGLIIRRIRTLQSPQKRRLPAIALTAFAKEEDQQEATVAGFQRHLSKPVNPDELIEVVASLASLWRSVSKTC